MQTIIDNLLIIQNTQTNTSLLNSLLKKQKQTQTALTNIMNAIEHGIINQTTNQRMQELESQLQEIEKQILIERSKINSHLTKEEITKFYLSALRLEPKLLIDYLIDEIILYDDKIKIKFNTPLKTSPATQGFSFALNSDTT